MGYPERDTFHEILFYVQYYIWGESYETLNSLYKEHGSDLSLNNKHTEY